MPVDLDGVHAFKAAKTPYGPGKAANAGGVAVSGLEMSQNSARISWSEDQLQKLSFDNSLCKIVREAEKYARTEIAIIVFWNRANELRSLLTHRITTVSFPGKGTSDASGHVLYRLPFSMSQRAIGRLIVLCGSVGDIYPLNC